MYIKDDQYASYKLLRTEFLKKGYHVDEEVIDDHRYVTYASPEGAAWRTSAALLKYPCISEEVREISRHKELAYAYASEHDVQVPYTHTLHGHEAISAKEAEGLLITYKKLIVKPSNASLSRGLTVNITSYEMLNRAIKLAREVCETVLIQQQVEGEEVRFTVIDGKVAAALLRQTPRVIGNGVSTVAELIMAENAERKALKFDYLSYPQLDASIIPSGYLTSAQVLEKGEILELNRATMVKNGCSIYDVFKDTDTSYVKTVERLVKNLDARFVVVDMFLKDFRVPQAEDNYWFIEFNTSPVLKLYYGCRDGKMFDIAPRLANSIDAGLQVEYHSDQVLTIK
jgi:D-alanine-D-alanine ligase-like ATP-grasp enzyme